VTFAGTRVCAAHTAPAVENVASKGYASVERVVSRRWIDNAS